jgi:hypothetical protein
VPSIRIAVDLEVDALQSLPIKADEIAPTKKSRAFVVYSL